MPKNLQLYAADSFMILYQCSMKWNAIASLQAISIVFMSSDDTGDQAFKA
jgi:hypothetical protein